MLLRSRQSPIGAQPESRPLEALCGISLDNPKRGIFKQFLEFVVHRVILWTYYIGDRAPQPDRALEGRAFYSFPVYGRD